jgi:hypothetical protein
VSTSRYKGFSILARPYALVESGRWTADLEIRRLGRSQPFSLRGRYRSEEEAQSECADLGRQIIDGGVPGWSVDHLRVIPPRQPRTFADLWRQQSNFVFWCAGLLILALSVYVILRFARS